MSWEIKVKKKPKPKIPWKAIGMVGGAIATGALAYKLTKRK